MKKSIKFIAATFALCLVTAQAQNEGQDCTGVSAAITNGIKADRSEVLNIVSQQLEQSPGPAPTRCTGPQGATPTASIPK